jgi:lysozyme
MNPSIVKRCLVGAVLAIAATLPNFQQLHTSVEGLKLIADYEGCRLQPYQCDAGVWTDGIGNTSGVVPGKTITERQAGGELHHQRITGRNRTGAVCPGERAAVRL